jgi:hypothetical protein
MFDGIECVWLVIAIALAYYLRARIIKYERDNGVPHCKD